MAQCGIGTARKARPCPYCDETIHVGDTVAAVSLWKRFDGGAPQWQWCQWFCALTAVE